MSLKDNLTGRVAANNVGPINMNTYTALVTVSYHSGETSIWVQVAAENAYSAKLQLESLYGQGKVRSAVTEVN